MANVIENLLVGARNWSGQRWSGEFFPDDMPEDWQFDYYGQHFKTILMSQSEWKNWDAESIEDFEILHESEAFFITFELSTYDDGALAQLKYLKNLLKEKAYGVLALNLSQTTVNLLGDTMGSEGYQLTACAPKPQIMGWSCNSSEGVLTGEPMFLMSIAGVSPKEMKELIMPFLNSLPEGSTVGSVFVVDKKVSSQTLLDLKLLVELLGY